VATFIPPMLCERLTDPAVSLTAAT